MSSKLIQVHIWGIFNTTKVRTGLRLGRGVSPDFQPWRVSLRLACYVELSYDELRSAYKWYEVSELNFWWKSRSTKANGKPVWNTLNRVAVYKIVCGLPMEIPTLHAASRRRRPKQCDCESLPDDYENSILQSPRRKEVILQLKTL